MNSLETLKFPRDSRATPQRPFFHLARTCWVPTLCSDILRFPEILLAPPQTQGRMGGKVFLDPSEGPSALAPQHLHPSSCPCTTPRGRSQSPSSMQNPTPTRSRAGQDAGSPERLRLPGSTSRKSSALVSLGCCECGDDVGRCPGRRRPGQRGTEEPGAAGPTGALRCVRPGECRGLGSGEEDATPLPLPTPRGPQESQEKSATGDCRCRGSRTCPWPSRPSKPATQRNSDGTF